MKCALSEPADYEMNQYTTTPVDNRRYDQNGNLISLQQCPASSAPQTDEFGAKNRYLSILAGDPGQRQAIRVTFHPSP